MEGFVIQEQPATEEPVSSTMILSEYETGAFRVVGVDGTLHWRTPREAASGRVGENIGDTPHVLAHSIQHGCTVVWFAKSSSGEVDAKIGAVTPRDGIRICMPNGIWEMKLVAGNLTIWRQWGMDTLDISVMVVKL